MTSGVSFNVAAWLPYVMPGLMAVAYIYFATHSSRRIPERLAIFIHLIVFGIAVYAVYLFNVKDAIEGNSALAKASDDAFIKKITSNTRYHIETDHIDIYPDMMEKRKVRFDFIPKTPEIVKLLKDTHFTKYYDQASYVQIQILIERFLRLYYNMLIYPEAYAVEDYQSLKHIRTELLNTFQRLITNVPLNFKRMIFRDKVPTDKYLLKRLRFLQAFTTDKLRTMSAKCDVRKEYGLRYKAPWCSNEFKNDHELF